ncbi:MAG: hypothetical protein JRI68_02915 [Deltaproteobacteria bacterium]|nr:hypothetical protein [Deltaproteobacteria bacterium]
MVLVGLAIWAGDCPAHAQVMVDDNLRLVARNADGQSLPLPLREERLAVVIDGQHATTTITQVYDNETPQVVEGLFSFRGGDGAHVSAFSYWNGDQRIVGEVLERKVAQQLYYQTVQERRDPGLLEKTGEGSFSFRVYPIQPREKKRIELRVEQWLPRQNRVVEYRVPVTKPNAEIDVSLHDERGIRAVRSPTHRIHTLGQGAHRRVRVGQALETARQLVIRYELADRPFQLAATVHHDAGGEAFFVATVAAPHLTSAVRQDLTLVVDANMGTADLALAKRAASRIVEGLRAGDRLSLVVVGDQSEEDIERPRWITRAVRADVRARLMAVPADQVGLLDDALGEILDAQVGSRRRSVMVLSNGRNASLELLRPTLEGRGNTRVLALGIGPTTDRAVMSTLAKLGGGTFVHVSGQNDLATVVDRLSEQVAGPVLRGARLHAEGAELRQVYPRGPQVLYQGRELRFVGRLSGTGTATLVLSGQAHRAVALRTKIDVQPPRRHPWVGSLWGRQRVDHLLEEIALEGESRERVRETTDWALVYNIVTPYTAFLAIPESELTRGDAQTLEEARARKRALVDQHPEVVGLMSPSMAGSDGADMEEAPMSMEAPAADYAEVHHGGCAGCRLGRQPTSKLTPWLCLALAVMALGRRRRKPSRWFSSPARD